MGQSLSQVLSCCQPPEIGRLFSYLNLLWGFSSPRDSVSFNAIRQIVQFSNSLLKPNCQIYLRLI